MIKNILNFLKCCKSKQKQQKEEIDIQIVGNKDIKKILSEYRIEDRDFNTFTSERSSIQTSNTKNEKFNSENSKDSNPNQLRLDTEIIEESKENRFSDKVYKETDLIKKNNDNLNFVENEFKNKNDYNNQILKSEEQILCELSQTNEDSQDDIVIITDKLIREDEKDFIKFVKNFFK